MEEYIVCPHCGTNMGKFCMDEYCAVCDEPFYEEWDEEEDEDE